MSLKAINRDWAALARKSTESKVPTGYVYIGGGAGDSSLKSLFGDIPYARNEYKGGDHSTWDLDRHGFKGCSPTNGYATPVENWEKATGLNYAQIIASPAVGSRKIAIEYSNGLYNTLRVRFEDKLKCESDVRYVGIKFLQLDGNFLSVKETLEDGVEVVSLSAFIARLEALPEKPKSVSAQVNGVKAIVDDGGLAIGCQFLSHEDFQKIKAAVDRKRETETVKTGKGMAVEIGNDVISGDELTFSFSDFDEIHELVKQVGKLS